MFLSLIRNECYKVYKLSDRDGMYVNYEWIQTWRTAIRIFVSKPIKIFPLRIILRLALWNFVQNIFMHCKHVLNLRPLKKTLQQTISKVRSVVLKSNLKTFTFVVYLSHWEMWTKIERACLEEARSLWNKLFLLEIQMQNIEKNLWKICEESPDTRV